MKRARYKNGSLVFDKHVGTWRFLQWIGRKRKSLTIGTKQEFPAKATAWRAAEKLRLSPDTPTHEAHTVRALAVRY